MILTSWNLWYYTIVTISLYISDFSAFIQLIPRICGLQSWLPNFNIEIFFAWLQLHPREQRKHAYHEAVMNRYKHLPEVKRIVR